MRVNGGFNGCRRVVVIPVICRFGRVLVVAAQICQFTVCMLLDTPVVGAVICRVVGENRVFHPHGVVAAGANASANPARVVLGNGGIFNGCRAVKGHAAAYFI